MYTYGSNVVKRFCKTKHWAIQHKREVTIEVLRYDDSMLEEIKKLYNPKEPPKRNQGKQYDVISIKEKRGESIAFYFYHNGKVIVRVWTHDNTRLEKVREIIGGKIIREYLELYIRYHERSETVVNTILEAILRKYGKERTRNDHMHKRRMITYLHRLNKFEINGLTITLKSYRHRSYGSKSPKDPEYHPKLELAILKKGEITKDDLKKALAILNTIVAIARLKQIWSKYDQAQPRYPLLAIDNTLYWILKGTTRRVKAIHILGKEYYDLNQAILDLLARGLRVREIARVLGYSHVAILKRIKALISQGYVKKEGRKYVVVEKLKPQNIIIPMTLKRFVEEGFKVKAIANRVPGTLILETEDGIKVEIKDLILKRLPGYLPAKAERRGDIRQYYLEIVDGKLKLTPIPFPWERTG